MIFLIAKHPKQASKVCNQVKLGIQKGEAIIGRRGNLDSTSSSRSFSDAAPFDQKADVNSSGASKHRGNVPLYPFGESSNMVEPPDKPCKESSLENEEKTAWQNIISSKTEALLNKKKTLWPSKGEESDRSDSKTTKSAWPWVHHGQENESSHQKCPTGVKPEHQVLQSADKETSDSLLPPFNAESTNTASSSKGNAARSSKGNAASSSKGSTSCVSNKVNLDTDICLDYEICWEDLKVGKLIGQGNHLEFIGL